jgi:hypothetical protein
MISTLILAMAMSLANTATTSADCGMQAPPAQMAGYRGIAFIGRVVGKERIWVPSDSEAFTVVTFRVARPIAGVNSASIDVMGGVRVSCHHFFTSVFRIGERVIVTLDPFEESFEGRPEDVVVAFHAVAWRSDAGGWRFLRRAVLSPQSYPRRALRADTLREITALLRPHHLTGTATARNTSGLRDPVTVRPLRTAAVAS